MYYVYVLYNQENEKIYIGITQDLERRLQEHNEKRGNHFTARYSGKWILIFSEEVKTKKEALIREKQLKSYKGRQYVKTFIPR